MKVVPWTRFGAGSLQLYKGDSYIILKTLDNEGVKDYDIFFWLGSSTSIDERGVAAYKTVELDAYFDGQASQSREVEAKESVEFRKMFPNLKYMEGGIKSGFRHVIEGGYHACLFHIRKTARGIVTKEVTLARESLNHGDCFVLDAENSIYTWSGDEANPMVKYEARCHAEGIESERFGKAKVTNEIDDRFWEFLGGEGPITSAEDAKGSMPEPTIGEGILYKLSDESGKLHMSEVGRGNLTKSMLDSSSVMLLDRESEIFIWIGSKASDGEKRNAYLSAMHYLLAHDRDVDLPIHMYKEGKAVNDKTWSSVFSD
jgi:hypothetical protein